MIVFGVVVVVGVGLVMLVFNCFLHFVELTFMLLFLYFSLSAVLLLFLVVRMFMLVVLVVIVRYIRVAIVHTCWFEMFLLIGVFVMLLLISHICPFIFVILFLLICCLFLHPQLIEAPHIPQHILRLRVTQLDLTVILPLLLFSHLFLSKTIITL